MDNQYPEKKFNIIGAGIIAYIASYLLMKSAEKNGQKIKITIGVSYSPALVELLQKLDKDNDLGKYTEILDPNREAKK